MMAKAKEWQRKRRKKASKRKRKRARKKKKKKRKKRNEENGKSTNKGTPYGKKKAIIDKRSTLEALPKVGLANVSLKERGQ